MLNVFFAPQSIGGATRVAQDQVQALAEQLGDQWEITVLCTQMNPGSCRTPTIERLGAARTDSACRSTAGTACVVRLALPVAPLGEHHDQRVEQLCRWWFARRA